MKLNSRRISLNSSGFSLVEIMVGLAIGLLLTVVIMQVSSVFESQKRATTGTSDAQTNGGIALYTIGRELAMAGYSLLPVTDSPLECATLTVNGVAGSPIPSLSPVTITEGVAASGVNASDVVTLRYGNAGMGGVPTQLTGLPVLAGASAASPVTSNLGCNINDTVVITNGNACAITTATAIPGTTTVTYADADAAKTAVTTTKAVVGANLSCLGTWTTSSYAISNGNLQRNGTDSTANIVNIQAQYGISASGLINTSPDFNKIANWVNASGGTWATPTVVNRNRIKAVRIAIVARNPKMEPGVVTTACTSTTAAATGLCAWVGTAADPAPTIDLSPGDANWARYRYRVFETIIPLRNVIWSKDTLL